MEKISASSIRTQEEFDEYLHKRTMDALKSYTKIVGKKDASSDYYNIIDFCRSNNLSDNFVLLRLEELLEEEKNKMLNKGSKTKIYYE